MSAHAWSGLSAALQEGATVLTLTSFPRYLFEGVRPQVSLEEAEEQARQRGQVISCEPGTLLAALGRAGATLKYAATEGNGVVSVVYKGSGVGTLFVINNRHSRADRLQVRLHPDVGPPEGEMLDLWMERRVGYSRGVLETSVDPKSARLFRLNAPA